jgi:hypothetical protein
VDDFKSNKFVLDEKKAGAKSSEGKTEKAKGEKKKGK